MTYAPYTYGNLEREDNIKEANNTIYKVAFNR
jgi:hypothetical protein